MRKYNVLTSPMRQVVANRRRTCIMDTIESQNTKRKEIEIKINPR
jgi:hypothetical protein